MIPENFSAADRSRIRPYLATMLDDEDDPLHVNSRTLIVPAFSTLMPSSQPSDLNAFWVTQQAETG